MAFKKTVFSRGGAITTIVIIIAVLIVLGYFGFNLRDIVNSPVVRDNLIFAKEIVFDIWNNYLKIPVNYIYGFIVKLMPN